MTELELTDGARRGLETGATGLPAVTYPAPTRRPITTGGAERPDAVPVEPSSLDRGRVPNSWAAVLLARWVDEGSVIRIDGQRGRWVAVPGKGPTIEADTAASLVAALRGRWAGEEKGASR